MNSIEIICPPELFKKVKYGLLFRKVKLEGLNKNILDDFLREHVYHNIPERDLETRYDRAYGFLKQIEEHPIMPAPKHPEKIKSITEETLGKLEEDIALVLRANEGKYCSFN